MPDQSLRYSQLIDFDHAAAGHDGIRSNRIGSLLIKPCKQAEVRFYEATAFHPEFRCYTPSCIGTLAPHGSANPTTLANSVRSSGRGMHVSGGSVSTADVENWVPSGGAAIVAENNIVLENVAYGFEKPNVLDVKLGRRLWADDAPLAKRQKLDKASSETTSGSLGFRIAGMKTWSGTVAGSQCDDATGYRKYDKFYGRSLTDETVRTGFRDYFYVGSAGVTPDLSRAIIACFVNDLQELVKVLENEESRMYSSSLLFVYEGDGSSLKRKIAAMESLIGREGVSPATAEPGNQTSVVDGHPHAREVEEEDDGSSKSSEEGLLKVQALKVIDFAHAAWTPGAGPDENMLFGVRNVIRILEEFLV